MFWGISFKLKGDGFLKVSDFEHGFGFMGTLPSAHIVHLTGAGSGFRVRHVRG